MPKVGALIPKSGEKLEPSVWNSIVRDDPRVVEISSYESFNPGTGDRVRISNPNNRIAEVNQDGKRLGILWLPKHPFEIGFEAFDEEFEIKIQELVEQFDFEIARFD